MKRLITAVILLTLIFTLLPTIPIQAATGVIDRQVITGADDCEVGANNHWNLTNTSSSTGYYNPTYYALETGMRFQSVAVPQGVTITTAYLVFTCQESTSGTKVNAIIRGEDTNDAVEFTLTNYKARVRTTAKVYWNNIETWTKDIEYPSPEIKTVIQEIVNRKNWSPGNDMVVFWGDTANSSTHANGCYRAQYTYEGSPTKSTRLHIEYSYTKDVSEDLEGLVGNLNELVERLDTQAEALSDTTTKLSSNLASLEEELNTISSELSSELGVIRDKLNAIEGRLSILETNIQTLETEEKASQRLLGVEERLTNLEGKSTITFLDWISLVILIILGVAIVNLVRERRTK